MKDINLFKTQNSIYLKKISSKNEILKEDDNDGYLLKTSEAEARRIVDSLKGKKKIIAVVGKEGDFNRRAIETLKINYLVFPEFGERKDSLKQRDSGLNHVLAKEAKKRNIAIVIDVNEIENLGGKQKALVLGRIIQNVKVCRRAKCDLKIANFSSSPTEILDEIERKSFGASLGMSSVQLKESTEFDPKIFKNKSEY